MANNDAISDLRSLLNSLKVTQSKLMKAIEDATMRTSDLETGSDPNPVSRCREGLNKETTSAHDDCGRQPPSRTVAVIPELLEQILLGLPMKDLLLAQRVNKAFRSIISSSKMIQQALFFTPEPEPPSGIPAGSLKLNPLLIAKSHRHTIPLFLVEKDTRISQWANVEFSTSPIFTDFLDGGLQALVVSKCTEITTKIRNRTQPAVLLQLGPAQDGVRQMRSDICKRGSWQRMYLSQPPVCISHSLDTTALCLDPDPSVSGVLNMTVRASTYGRLFQWKTADSLVRGI